MPTPYPFDPHSRSSSESHHGSNSSLASSVITSSDDNEQCLWEATCSIEHMELGSRQHALPGGDYCYPRPAPPPYIPPETRLKRLRYINSQIPIPAPKWPTRRNDFPGKPAQGDPSIIEKVEYSPVDGPRWSDAEYRQVLTTAMIRKYPPDLKSVAQARDRVDRRVASPPRLEGFGKTLDLLKEIKRGNRAEFGAWSERRSLLEEGLAKKARNLRAEWALHVEKIHRLHHAQRQYRVSKDFYLSARGHHIRQIRLTTCAVHDVALVAGTLYSERAALAQGCVPRHGENWGKLDMTACKPTRHVNMLFPEFVRRPPGPSPDDLAPPDYPLPTQPSVLNRIALDKDWEEECRPRLAQIHIAGFRGEWQQVLELTRDSEKLARRVLAGEAVVDVRTEMYGDSGGDADGVDDEVEDDSLIFPMGEYRRDGQKAGAA